VDSRWPQSSRWSAGSTGRNSVLAPIAPTRYLVQSDHPKSVIVVMAANHFNQFFLKTRKYKKTIAG